MPDPADLVNTILAATADAMFAADAEWPDGERLFEWRNCPNCPGGKPCSCAGVPHPSKPVRAGLAAAIHTLADHAIDPEAPDDPRWTAGRLRDLADQLDAQETP